MEEWPDTEFKGDAGYILAVGTTKLRGSIFGGRTPQPQPGKWGFPEGYPGKRP